MDSEADRDEAVLVISVWREPDSRPSFRGRLVVDPLDEELGEKRAGTTHAEILDLVAQWLRRRMPED